MARQRTTFGKMQRDRAKQAKARAKVERKATRAEERDEAAPPADAPADQSAVLNALARLQEAYASGAVGLEEFESRRDDLRQQLRID